MISNITRARFCPKQAFIRHNSPFRRNTSVATHTHTTMMHKCFQSSKTLDPTGNSTLPPYVCDKLELSVFQEPYTLILLPIRSTWHMRKMYKVTKMSHFTAPAVRIQLEKNSILRLNYCDT